MKKKGNQFIFKILDDPGAIIYQALDSDGGHKRVAKQKKGSRHKNATP
jgi:hypothetical protein